MGKEATADYIKEMQSMLYVILLMHLHKVKQFRHLPHLEEDHPNTWRNSWLEGVTSGIMSSLLDQERERTKETSTALMVVSKAIDVAYEDLSSNFKKVSGGGNSNRNYSAFHAGQTVGKSIKIGSKRLT